MGDIISINTGLHAKAGNGVQHIVPNTIKITVVLNGFFRNTAVNHHHRNMTFANSTQKIRPQLRFYWHKYARMNTFNQRFSYERQIQRKIDNRIRLGNNLLSHIIAAYSKSTDQYWPIRHSFAYLLNQRTGRNNFTYGSAMNPNTILAHNLSYFLFINTAKNLLLKPKPKALFCKQTISVIWYDKNHQHY